MPDFRWSTMLLATVRPVGAPPGSAAAVLEAWEQTLAARADVSRAGARALAWRLTDGQTARVEITATTVSFSGLVGGAHFFQVPSERRGVEESNARLRSAIDERARSLARLLRWGVFTEGDPVPYAPRHVCQNCAAPIFEDEEDCPACGARGPAEAERLAEGFLRLLQKEGLECPPDIASSIANLFRQGSAEVPSRMLSELARLAIDTEGLSAKRLGVLIDWARRGADFTKIEVFRIRPPGPSEFAGHDPSALRRPDFGVFAGHPNAVRWSDGGAVLHDQNGHELVFTRAEHSIRVHMFPQSLGEGARAKQALRRLATEAAGRLQHQCGWYVFENGELPREFQRVSNCAACNSECFQHQRGVKGCRRCGLTVGTSKLALGRAEDAVHTLVTRRYIETAADIPQRRVVFDLAPHLHSLATSESIARALRDLDSVQKVLADDALLRNVLDPLIGRTHERHAATDVTHDTFHTINQFVYVYARAFELNDGATIRIVMEERHAYPPPSVYVTFRGVSTTKWDEVLTDPDEWTWDENDPPEEIDVTDPKLRLARLEELRARSIHVPAGHQAFCVASSNTPRAFIVAREVELDVPDRATPSG